MSKKLLFSVTRKDFEITYFSGHGAGGQHRNKCQNCCRLMHKETGIIKTGQSSRSRKENEEEALKGFIRDENFKKWLKMKAAEKSNLFNNVEKMVEKLMSEEYLKIEVFDKEKDEWHLYDKKKEKLE